VIAHQLHDSSSQVPFIPVSSAAICDHRDVLQSPLHGIADVIYNGTSVNNENFRLSKGYLQGRNVARMIMPSGATITGPGVRIKDKSRILRWSTDLQFSFKSFYPDTSSSGANYRVSSQSNCTYR
jgi:hypothetical protein